MVLNSNSTIYGRKPAKAISHDIRSKSLKAYGFNFPIGETRGSGYLSKSAGIELIKNNLKQLLLTQRGERVMLPMFGTNLKRYLMEPLDETLLNQIKIEILDSFNRYARNISIIKLQVFPGNTATLMGGHYLIIKLFCKLKEEENVTFEVKVDLI
tara:strand:- start:1175 stop:1639 length:465 start_codon:yes stop_codon:yes gene_type:complete